MAGGTKSGKSGKSGWTRWKNKKKAIKGQKVRNEEIQKLIQERDTLQAENQKLKRYYEELRGQNEAQALLVRNLLAKQ